MSDNVSIKLKTEGLSTTGEILLGSNQVQEVIQALINEFDLKIKELEKTCKLRSDTIIEYSNKIAELEKKQRDIIKGIKLCFGRAIASDNTLLVNADVYNLLVATCNNRKKH